MNSLILQILKLVLAYQKAKPDDDSRIKSLEADVYRLGIETPELRDSESRALFADVLTNARNQEPDSAQAGDAPEFPPAPEPTPEQQPEQEEEQKQPESTIPATTRLNEPTEDQTGEQAALNDAEQNDAEENGDEQNGEAPKRRGRPRKNVDGATEKE